MSKIRYLLVTKTRSIEEARRRKVEEIEYAKARVRAAREELKEIRRSPLAIEWREQIEVGPDDPRYKEACSYFDPRFYHGEFSWKTLESGGSKP